MRALIVTSTLFAVAMIQACVPDPFRDNEPLSAPTLGDESQSIALVSDVLPPQFEASLSRAGFTAENLQNPGGWALPNAFELGWIFVNSSDPSMKRTPERAPELAQGVVEAYRAALNSDAPLSELIAIQAGLNEPTRSMDDLRSRVSVTQIPALDVDDPLLSALWGVYVAGNPIENAFPGSEWNSLTESSLSAVTETYPRALNEALAEVVLWLGLLMDLKVEALSDTDEATVQAIFDAFLTEDYASTAYYFMKPVQNDTITLLQANAASIDHEAISRAAAGFSAQLHALADVAAAADWSGVAPLNALTPLGRIAVFPPGEDNDHRLSLLSGPTFVLDAGGNDTYTGSFAATSELWMPASVLIDLAGDDQYNPGLDDIRQPGMSQRSVFDILDGLAQGVGLLGAGILMDLAGNDQYRATVMGQGAGIFGAGVLWDESGNDTYLLSYLGQGMGYFGTGLLADDAGDDTYVIITNGQGLGRPWGQGSLIDAAGNDTYLALHDDDGDELSMKYPDHLRQPTGYSDSDGETHALSIAQGVGWGYRGDWVDDFTGETRNWFGGSGILADLGNGNDTITADCMNTGQGFVYGVGIFHQDGGSDRYRNFWWGFGSGTHMGFGLMFAGAGNDDIFTTRASAGLGHDWGQSWYIDAGGDDTYAGRMTQGRALDHGQAFFIDRDGTDSYATVQPTTSFGTTHWSNAPVTGVQRVGLFMDLGGDDDVYPVDAPATVGNNVEWINEPIGNGAPTTQPGSNSNVPGIGLDE